MESLEELEARLSDLEVELQRARANVDEWTVAASSLSRSAAEARANNQGAGKGFMGALLGSKVRKALRAGAAASNAAIAKDVAKKRSDFASGKAAAQAYVKQVQTDIADAKAQIREVKAAGRGGKSAKVSSAVDLLHKLKEAHKLGLLTDEEFEEKRRKIVSEM